VIERAFGILKRRFACLTQPVRTKLETTKKIIMVDVGLHNITMLHHIDPPEMGETGEPLADAQEILTNIANDAFYIRNTVIQRWF